MPSQGWHVDAPWKSWARPILPSSLMPVFGKQPHLTSFYKLSRNRNTYHGVNSTWDLEALTDNIYSMKRLSSHTDRLSVIRKDRVNDSGKWAVGNETERVPQGCGIQSRRGNMVSEPVWNAQASKMHTHIHTHTHRTPFYNWRGWPSLEDHSKEWIYATNWFT